MVLASGIIYVSLGRELAHLVESYEQLHLKRQAMPIFKTYEKEANRVDTVQSLNSRPTFSHIEDKVAS
jgi:hypothetical protein